MCATALEARHDCTACSRQASTCFIAPQELEHGHPSPHEEARSGLGSGRRSRGDSPSQQSHSPMRWLERLPETCNCDTAQEPAPSQKQQQQQASGDCTAGLFISKQASSGLFTGKEQDANSLPQYEEGHREMPAEGTSPTATHLCVCVRLRAHPHTKESLVSFRAVHHLILKPAD